MKSKSACNSYVIAVIARNYNSLKSALVSDVEINISGRSYEDIFEDTILFIASDPAASSIKVEAAILDHFKYRFKMIRFRVFANSKEITMSSIVIQDEDKEYN